MRVLVVNAGSSTLKLGVVGPHDAVEAHTTLTIAASAAGAEALRNQLVAFVAAAGAVDAVGHRVVHGGERFRGPVRLDAGVIDELRALVPLAPLHQPNALAAIDAVSGLLPDRPALACFDTAFHATMPPAATTYAIPRAWRDRWPVRRFGFHGLSHAWIARRVPELLGHPVGRLVSCHLGAGASLCAIRDGRSIDTTMGFTPMEGLVMATRSGTVDPGLVLWLIEEARLSPADVRNGLVNRGGLAALAGVASGDLRDVLAAGGNSDDDDGGDDDDGDGDDGDARAAYDTWLHRLVRELGAMVASLDGLDAIAFTGGIGEHQARVRADVIARCNHLVARIDDRGNHEGAGDADLTGPGSAVRVLRITAREDAEIARQVGDALAPRDPSRRGAMLPTPEPEAVELIDAPHDDGEGGREHERNRVG